MILELLLLYKCLINDSKKIFEVLSTGVIIGEGRSLIEILQDDLKISGISSVFHKTGG